MPCWWVSFGLLACAFWCGFLPFLRFPSFFLQQKGENIFFWAGFSWLLTGFISFLGIGAYASETDGIWVKAACFVFFFPSISESLSSPLISSLDLSHPPRACAEEVWKKTKAEKGSGLWVVARGLREQGCGSPGSWGSGARHQQSAHELGAAVLSTEVLRSATCSPEEGIAFFPVAGVKDQGLIWTPPDRVEQFPLHLSSFCGCTDWEDVLFLVLLHGNKCVRLCLRVCARIRTSGPPLQSKLVPAQAACTRIVWVLL